MTEYAISLYLDKDSSERMLELMHSAADACGNEYMLKPKLMHPHITVCYFRADDIVPIEQIVDDEVRRMKRGNVIWSSIGAFVPSVLFAVPILNEYLIDACTVFNSRIADKVTLVDYYRPYKWMPHTTLATKLTSEQLNAAFTAVAVKFMPFQGTIEALSLARCEPFTDLRVWQLAHTIV